MYKAFKFDDDFEIRKILLLTAKKDEAKNKLYCNFNAMVFLGLDPTINTVDLKKKNNFAYDPIESLLDLQAMHGNNAIIRDICKLFASQDNNTQKYDEANNTNLMQKQVGDQKRFLNQLFK